MLNECNEGMITHMNFNEYTKEAKKTESVDFDTIIDRFNYHDNSKGLIRAMMTCSIGSSILDIFKKHFFYGKDIDYDALSNLFSSADDLSSHVDDCVVDYGMNNNDLRILHAIMGLVTESGELVDSFLPRFIHGNELDMVNIQEEIGDLMWYAAVLIDAVCPGKFEEILCKNVEKLRKRYTNRQFSKECALNRDVDNELSHFNRDVTTFWIYEDREADDYFNSFSPL